MKIVNLTPHAVQLHGTQDGAPAVLTVAPSGQLARLAVTRESRPAVDLDGITLAVARPTMGEVTGLPVPVEGTIYVVSALVAEAVKRGDVMSPGELLRDGAGVITGARGLCAYV